MGQSMNPPSLPNDSSAGQFFEIGTQFALKIEDSHLHRGWLLCYADYLKCFSKCFFILQE